MSISSLSSAGLKNLIGLVEKREALQAEIAKVDAAIDAAVGGEAPAAAPAKRGRKPKAQPLSGDRGYSVGNARKPGRRGGLKDKVLAELKSAGKAGVSVKDIAAKLGVKSQNVHVWFATTGKKLAKKVSPGVYALA